MLPVGPGTVPWCAPRPGLAGCVWAEPSCRPVPQALEFKICKMRPSARCLVRRSAGALAAGRRSPPGQRPHPPGEGLFHGAQRPARGRHLPQGCRTCQRTEHPHQPGLTPSAEEPYESKVRAARGWRRVCLCAPVGGGEEGASSRLRIPSAAELDSDQCVETCGSFLNVF